MYPGIFKDDFFPKDFDARFGEIHSLRLMRNQKFMLGKALVYQAKGEIDKVNEMIKNIYT